MTPACKVKVETVEKIKTEGSEMRQYNLQKVINELCTIYKK